VPHPEVVDLAIQIHNDSATALEGATVEVESQWLEGQQSRKASAVWRNRMPVGKPLTVRIPPNEKQTVTVPIDLAEKMKALGATNRWPWAVRTFVYVESFGQGNRNGSVGITYSSRRLSAEAAIRALSSDADTVQLTAFRLNFRTPSASTTALMTSSAPIVAIAGMCGTCGTREPRMPSLA
jgi:hypothetical protein